jgi:hypothetical protein
MRARRRGWTPLALVCLVALLTAALWQFAAGGADAEGGGALVAQPYQGAPTLAFLGASPLEAPGEVWAVARGGATLARYSDGGGWETVPAPVGTEGQPIAELSFAAGAAVGRTTPHGGIVAAATAGEEQPLLVVRDPGGPLRVAPKPPSAVLGPEEALFAAEGAGPLLATLEGSGGSTRALVVPTVASGVPEAVLSFVAGNWSREPICVGFAAGPACTAPGFPFQVLAIEAGGGEAWLLAKGAAPGEGIELFRREATGGVGGTPVWRQQPLGPAGSLGSRFAQAAPAGVPVAARVAGQPLTVTGAGVWVDAQLTSGGEKDDATLYYDIGAGEVTGSWCDLTSPPGLCTEPLGAELPAGQGRSFAWPPGGGSGPFGQRVITGVGQGAILSLEGDAFTRLVLGGGSAGASEGAALSAPEEGWLGAEPPLRLTHTPESTHLTAWPVPFRRPLTAIAPAPGEPVGVLSSEALAVGADGEAARYVPGQGWEPEFLLTASGKRATPTLRGVAWPEPGRAFAVGDGAAMWVWQKATGFWEPDPAEPPNLVRANFTGIAFDPGEPSRGYAVGKQGLLLGYGRTWTQEQLPAGIPAEANFTSIAFAGEEALATYKFPVNKNGAAVYTGGVLVNDGSGWQVDQGAEAALGGAVPERVAGLPDGGAVIASEEGVAAGEGAVIEREGASATWQPASGGSPGYPAALAAIREGGQVRAIVSVAKGQGGEDLGDDSEQVFKQPPSGQAPLLSNPYPLPGSGLLLRQTATGWRDEQHQGYPLQQAVEGQTGYDLPLRPDPVLALLTSPDGGQGWAVGGETGTFVRFQGEEVQTAGVQRFGAESAPPPSNASATAIPPTAGTANFALGGNAQCAGPCADLSGTGIGPERWLAQAVGKAAGIQEMRAFLYTGPGVATAGAGPSERLGAILSPHAFSREETAYAQRLGASAGALPTFAAPAETDLNRSSSLSTFQAAFSGFEAPFGSAPPGAGIEPDSPAGPEQAYYSFASAGNGGTVRVIVLDYSAPALGAKQSCWLAGQLSAAGVAETPAIVIGQRDLAGLAPNAAKDAAQVVPILVGAVPGGCAVSGPPAAASAYFFDYPEQNRQYSLIADGRSIPAFGSGTLGYVAPPRRQETDFVGASGFLIVSVNAAARNSQTNVAPVSTRLIPGIGALALDATDGTLLRRGHQALFEALARRPLGGSRCTGNFAPRICETQAPDPYIPIPTECRGQRCATGLFPEYTFTSSSPDIANFVAHDPASLNPRNVELVNGKPVLSSTSGLLCAFNAGTTTVTISAGGLTYSQKVTVLGGTVQRPCGTTPLTSRVASSQPAAVPPPAPAPAPSPAPAPLPLAVPPAPAPATPPAPPAPAPTPPPAPTPAPAFFLAPPNPTPLVPIVPPPPAPAFQPTPPSGTAPVGATEDEEEEEEAYDLVSQMTALRHAPRPAAANAAAGGGGGGGINLALPALVLLAAVAAAGLRGTRPRRGSRPNLAYEATTTPRRYR